MDFVRYAEASARLLNADPASVDALVATLDGREWLHPQVTQRDVTSVRRFLRGLRPVFDAADAGEVKETIEQLNALMVQHPITPRISDHDPDDLHLHVATRAASVAELLIGESLLGLATLVCDVGPTRLGVCSASNCTNVFVDTSPNHSRRYCSDRCSSRANVAAYRARQKAALPPVVEEVALATVSKPRS
jgi:predicted RNA-binding Zn ribbon-like protein